MSGRSTMVGGSRAPRVTSRIRKRSVSFGNPALGTYHGFVYTEDHNSAPSSSLLRSSPPSRPGDHPRPLIEGAMEVQRLVALLDVPPEQVPEGILNLVQPHQPWVHHMRIVIAEPACPKEGEPLESAETKQQLAKTETPTNTLYSSFSPSPNASAMETAASILAAEHELATAAEVKSNTFADDTTAEAAEMDKGESRSQLYNRTYLVLIELTTEDAAAEMVQDLDGQPYTIMDETVTCSAHHVVALEGVAGVALMSPFFAPQTEGRSPGKLEIPPSHDPDSADAMTTGLEKNESENMTTKPAASMLLSEDYNCAVCLEHMDLDSPHTSILTTVCNHSFHVDCLMQWQDSPCPVCRYDHSGLNEALSQCHLCGTTENNYVCLICGVVSCGGSSIPAEARHPDTDCATATASIMESSSRSRVLSTSHARQHYHDTLHAYALCTETQHVWDFAGNGYVHRLLQNKDDGKLVEVSDPSNTTSHERSSSPGLSGAQEEQVVHRKLEGFASQYYTLLKSQLEQQRIFYEGRLEEIRREHARQNHTRVVSTADWIAALRQEHHQLSQRLGSVQAKCRRVRDDVAFVQSLNESLEANRGPLRAQVEMAQRDRVEAHKMFDECLPPLQEKVTRLMLQLETSFSSGIGASEGAADNCPPESSPDKPAAR